jgi:AAA domain
VIKNRQDEIVRLHATYSGDRSVPDTNGHRPSTSPFRGDAEIIERARSEKNGKFDRLWQGDTAAYGHDHSAADDAFVHKLWPYTQDEEQIRRIHTMSGLHRPEKSGRRPDYLQRSIERARQNVTWFHEWPGEQTPQFSSDGNHDPALPSTEIHSDHPIESGFGQIELLPLKTPKDIIEAAKDGTNWIVEGLLAPDELTDLAGLAKYSGKTTFITHMLDAAIEGEEFIGLDTRKTKVLFLTEQGNNFATALMKSGLVNAGEALRIVQYRDLDGKARRWDTLIKAATGVCVKDGYEVLVVDTFAGLAGLKGTEENNVGDISEKMAP